MKYRVSTNLDEMDFDLIHRFLANTYWSKNIPASVLKKGLENSLCFALFEDNPQEQVDSQIGFARIITDKSTFAYLADVFIVESHRNQGLSKLLLDYIFSCSDLQGLRRTLLATADAHGLYQKYGFTPLNKPSFFMERWFPDIYQSDKKMDD